MDAGDRHADGALHRGREVLPDPLGVPRLAADDDAPLGQAAEAARDGQHAIRVGEVDVADVGRLVDLGLDHEDGSRLRAAIDGVDDDQPVAAGHELLDERHPADPALEHLDAGGHVGEARRYRVAEPVVDPQHVADAGDDDARGIVQAPQGTEDMPRLDQLLDDLERLLGDIETLDGPVRESVFSLLDGIDELHRHALERLGGLLEPAEVERLRAADPAVAWLFHAYAVGIDEHAAAEAALETVRPYLHSHGGDVSVLACRAGVVRVRLTGACSGCTASTITLRRGVEEALREHLPGFAAMEVEEDDALPHPPPGPTLLQIETQPPAPSEVAPLLQIETRLPPPAGGAAAP